jgi:hypothetical protein
LLFVGHDFGRDVDQKALLGGNHFPSPLVAVKQNQLADPVGWITVLHSPSS